MRLTTVLAIQAFFAVLLSAGCDRGPSLPETCNLLDDDRDGLVDEGGPETCAPLAFAIDAVCAEGACSYTCEDGFFDCTDRGGCESRGVDFRTCGGCAPCGVDEVCAAGARCERIRSWGVEQDSGMVAEAAVATGDDLIVAVMPSFAGAPVEETATIVRLDPDLAPRWTVRAFASGDAAATPVAIRSLASGPGGDLYAVGDFFGPVLMLGDRSLARPGFADRTAFLARLDALDGGVDWLVAISSPDLGEATLQRGLAVSVSDDRLLVGGSFGPRDLVTDGFVAEFSTDGQQGVTEVVLGSARASVDRVVLGSARAWFAGNVRGELRVEDTLVDDPDGEARPFVGETSGGADDLIGIEAFGGGELCDLAADDGGYVLSTATDRGESAEAIFAHDGVSVRWRLELAGVRGCPRVVTASGRTFFAGASAGGLVRLGDREVSSTTGRGLILAELSPTDGAVLRVTFVDTGSDQVVRRLVVDGAAERLRVTGLFRSAFNPTGDASQLRSRFVFDVGADLLR